MSKFTCQRPCRVRFLSSFVDFCHEVPLKLRNEHYVLERKLSGFFFFFSICAIVMQDPRKCTHKGIQLQGILKGSLNIPKRAPIVDKQISLVCVETLQKKILDKMFSSLRRFLISPPSLPSPLSISTISFLLPPLLSLCLCLCLSVTVCLSVFLSISVSDCLSVCLSVCLSPPLSLSPRCYPHT